MTASLKVTSRFASIGILTALFWGMVLVISGAESLTVQGFNGEAVLRGFGEPVLKSAALLSVSVQPFAARNAALVLLKTGAAALPS